MRSSPTIITAIFLFFSFSMISQYSLPYLIDSSNSITDIKTADINNDGLKDIIVSQRFSFGNRISYSLNTGSNTFSNLITIDSNLFTPLVVKVADINNDGKIDVLTHSSFCLSCEVLIFENNFPSFNKHIIDSVAHPVEINLGDINNDGHTDLVIPLTVDINVYYGNSDFTFIKTPINLEGGRTHNYSSAIGDINNDSYPDLIVGGGGLFVFKNDSGILKFDTIRSAVLAPGLIQGNKVTLGDLNNDGHLDLLRNNNPQLTVVDTNNGFGFFGNYGFVDSNARTKLILNDLDRDGDLDYLSGYNSNYKVAWSENIGNGNFSIRKVISYSTYKLTTVWADDLNNDGWPDIIWANPLYVQFSSRVTDIETNPIEPELLIYPNPTKDFLYINKSGDNNNLVQIFSLNGKLLINSYLNSNYLNLNDLPPGVYLLKFSGITKKIIVQ